MTGTVLDEALGAAPATPVGAGSGSWPHGRWRRAPVDGATGVGRLLA